MKKKNVIIVIILILAVLLAVLFMVKGAKDTGRKYTLEAVENYDYFVLQKDNKFGVIDKDAKIVIEPIYENIVIPNPSKGVFVCYVDNNKTKIYNEKNEQILSDYDEVTAIRLKNATTDLMYEKSVLKYKSENKYGLIDYEGGQITEPIYRQIDALGYKEGEFIVEQDEKYGVINIKGANLVQIKYETISVDGYYTEKGKYSEAGYIVGIKTDEGYRYGYIDVDGNGLLELEYNDISRITDINDSENIYLIASKNGQYGVYKNRNKIINNEYQSIHYDKNTNLFVVEKSKKYGIVDIDGNEIVEVKYSQIDINGDYLYVREKNGATEVLDLNGQATNMSENTSIITVADGKYKIVIESNELKTTYSIEDENEKRLFESNYTYLEYLYDDYFIACNEEGKLGIINDSGEQETEFIFDSIQKIKETKLIQATISTEKITQIYSPKMKKVYEISDVVIAEIDEYIEVYNNEKRVYLTQNGEIVDNKKVYKDNELFSINKDGKWGFEDKSGKIKVECIYDKVTEFNKFGFAGIKQENKWGVIDNKGKVIVEPKYEFDSNIDPSFLGAYYKVTYGYGEVYYTNK